MPHFVVTASRLRDGAIVWATDAGWSEHFAAAAIHDATTIETALATAAADIRTQRVVGVYKVEVSPTADGFEPVSVREIIRATGPSVRPDLGYAATAQVGD